MSQNPTLLDNAVLAPVVVDARTTEGVAAFLSYVDTLTRHSNIEIAEAESRRLQPYFRAMSEYVTEALQKPPPVQPKPGHKMPDGSIYLGATTPPQKNASNGWYWSSSQGYSPPWYQPTAVPRGDQEELTSSRPAALLNSTSPRALSTAWDSPSAAATPEGLSDLFNAMAQTTHATLISDVVIIPSNMRSGPAAHLFKDHWEFHVDYGYLGHPFDFGFLQAYEGGKQKSAKSSTTFPVFTVASDMIDALPAGQGEPVLRDLQRVFTLINHDMLHHFTSPVINPETVYRKRYTDGGPLTAWASALPGLEYSSGGAYEEWALRVQEKVINQPAAKTMVEQARAAVDDYLDRLEQIRDVLSKPLCKPAQHVPPALENMFKNRAHEVIDYFGTVMAHTLARAYPLNHEIVQHCLDRLEKIDPSPESVVRDCAAMFRATRPDGTVSDGLGDDGNPKYAKVEDVALKVIAHELSIDPGYASTLRTVVKSYAKLGAEIFPEDVNSASYKHFKMLQLVKLDSKDARIPAPEAVRLNQFRENMNDYTLKALRAAAEHSAPALRQRGLKPA